MNKKLIERLQQIFEDKLKSKTSWGRNEIILLHTQCVAQATLEIIDEEEKKDSSK